MCGVHYPDDIIVCPACKRDDEIFRCGEGDSPFTDLGGGRIACICGKTFTPESALRELTAEQKH